jgi:nicotinamidase-related amidase
MSPLTFDPSSTALVLIDLQNGIVGLPLAPHSGSAVVGRSVQLADKFRERGAAVIFVRVPLGEILHFPVDSPARSPDAPVPPAAASELIANLNRQPSDLVIVKRQWGAFYGTELDQQLRRRGIRTIVLGGIATNFGVESTARAAFDRGYHLVFVEDAMSTVSAEAHAFAVGSIFPRMGRVRSTDVVLDALKA